MSENLRRCGLRYRCKFSQDVLVSFICGCNIKSKMSQRAFPECGGEWSIFAGRIGINPSIESCVGGRRFESGLLDVGQLSLTHPKVVVSDDAWLLVASCAVHPY